MTDLEGSRDTNALAISEGAFGTGERGFEFDAATALKPVAEGRWSGEIADGWDFAGLPNGGYLMSIVVQAIWLSFRDRIR